MVCAWVKWWSGICLLLCWPKMLLWIYSWLRNWKLWNILHCFMCLSFFFSFLDWKRQPQELFLILGLCFMWNKLGQCPLWCLESQPSSSDSQHDCLFAVYDGPVGKGGTTYRQRGNFFWKVHTCLSEQKNNPLLARAQDVTYFSFAEWLTWKCFLHR